MSSYILKPDPGDPRLTRRVRGVDESGARIETSVVVERPLTLFLNGQEIVTMMTIGDHPDCLAVGYLINQNMLQPEDEITGIDHDDDLGVMVVRTARKTDFERKLRKKTLTSGCAQGTVFGDMMDGLQSTQLPDARSARISQSMLRNILEVMRQQDSIHRKAGSVHGCALFRGTEKLMFIEDVGRHNAIDTIAGWMWMNHVQGADKVFYTTGRLTSEMVMKSAQIGVPIIVSRNGVTAMGHEMAKRLGMTLFGRASNRHFICYTGFERFDSEPEPQRAPVRVVAG